VLLGNGNGTFKAAQNFAMGVRTSAVAVADLNGDGLPDLVATNLKAGSVSVLLSQRNTATHLLVSAPASVTAGTAFTITVSALTADGHVDDQYTGTVHFTSSDGAALLPADYTFTKGDLGVHTFTVTLNTTGSQTLTAADTKKKTIKGTATVTVSSSAPPPGRSSGTGSAADATATVIPKPADGTGSEAVPIWLAEHDRAEQDPDTWPPTLKVMPQSSRDLGTPSPRVDPAGGTAAALAPPSTLGRHGLLARDARLLDPALVDAFFAES
jgi:hypothetical protein